jgi:hypothetical protein
MYCNFTSTGKNKVSAQKVSVVNGKFNLLYMAESLDYHMPPVMYVFFS